MSIISGIPDTYLYIGAGIVVVLFLFSVLRGGKSKTSSDGKILSTDPVQTIIECYEASGLFTIVKPVKEEATKITFKYGDQDWHPSKTNPFVPAGRALRIFRWAIGSSTCDDPQAMHGSKDVDDPSPMMEEGASWYRTLRQALGALGVSLKNPFLILLLVVVAGMALSVGYILGNTNPIHP